MADRVHPYVDDVEGTPACRPSILGGDVQKAGETGTTGSDVHKEQEQSLIGNEAASVDEAAVVHGGRWRRGRCVRCCCWVSAVGGICVVLVGVLVLLFFLLLHPKLPKYTITAANMTSFSISGDTAGGEGGLSLNADLQFSVMMRNPNKKIGLDYRSITATLFYDDMTIGEGAIPGFYQGHRNTTLVRLALVGHAIPLTPSLGASLQERLGNQSSLSLRTRAIVRLRLRIGRWTSHTSKVRLKCHLQITNPARASVQLLSNSCKFKLLRLRL